MGLLQSSKTNWSSLEGIRHQDVGKAVVQYRQWVSLLIDRLGLDDAIFDKNYAKPLLNGTQIKQRALPGVRGEEFCCHHGCWIQAGQTHLFKPSNSNDTDVFLSLRDALTLLQTKSPSVASYCTVVSPPSFKRR